MKKLFSNNWQAKLTCFLIALLIWVVLKSHIQPGFFDQVFTGTLTPPPSP